MKKSVYNGEGGLSKHNSMGTIIFIGNYFIFH
ncbi:hypothetical protein HNP81_004754 [Peribacillus huizhouensis]|uniref:Uncharacterized protein n=1 Tax=Peribacillus huizhouensis TaxID=1501239 RepID=A0ABR6CWP0_9BACI|nr:hypothetical protein [Peribacillus huizhouensis]